MLSPGVPSQIPGLVLRATEGLVQEERPEFKSYYFCFVENQREARVEVGKRDVFAEIPTGGDGGSDEPKGSVCG